MGDHTAEARVFALRERGLDTAARIVENAHPRQELLVQAFGGALQIELDHFRRAGADQEQRRDVRTPIEELPDTAIELVVGIGETGKITFAENGGRETRFGKDHDAGRRLHEVRAGAGADHEEERVLHLPVQPDDAGESAEDFALSALANDGELHHRTHAATT